MLPVFHGVKDTIIGMDEFLVKCPACEAHHWADVMVISNYAHIYYFPLFPIDKAANVICQNCGLRRYNVSFNKTLISDYDEVKKRFRHPWINFSGIAVAVALITAIIIRLVLN